MKDTRAWKAALAPVLADAWPDDTTRLADQLLDTELVLYLWGRVASGHRCTDAWALLGGYPFLQATGTPVGGDAETMLHVARHLVLRFKDQADWRDALNSYTSMPEILRGYVLDLDTDTVTPRQPSVLPERWDSYEQVLTASPPDNTGELAVAEHGRYFNAAQPFTSVEIPEWVPLDPQREGHDVQPPGDREPLTISWAELEAAARHGDELEARYGWPTRSNWAQRLARVNLEVRQADNTFCQADQLTVDGIMHMIGMVGAGKSTLVDVLVLWCALHEKRVCVVADNVTAVLRKVAHLQALGLAAAPVLGQSNRLQHLTRLHRLTAPPTAEVGPVDEPMFDLTSTACGLDGLRDHVGRPWDIRHAPCTGLLPARGDEEESVRDSRRAQGCPLWQQCQRHQPSRDLVHADIWVATTASLVHTPVPRHLNDERLRYLELAWRRSDLIIIDEADQVQAQLDSVFSPEQKLVGPDDEAWLDEIMDRTNQALRRSGRQQMHDPLVRQWLNTLNNAKTATDLLYSALSQDRDRSQPALDRRWLDKGYFTEWTLSQQLAQSWAGYGRSQGHRPEEGWEADPAYQRLRRAFDGFIDDPLGRDDPSDDVTRSLVELTATCLRDAKESTRFARISGWLTELSKPLAEDGLNLVIDDQERQVIRLEFTIMVAVLADQLNQLIHQFRAVEIELGLEGTSSALFHHSPADYAPVVPDSPMGNVLGFQYLDEDTPSERRSAPMGRLRFFRCGGVGRWVLQNMHQLFATSRGQGSNVLLLSGTSWAGTSARYHVDVPVTAILTPPAQEIEAVKDSRFDFLPLYSGDRSLPIRVSGKQGEERAHALREMVRRLVHPGVQKSILEQHRDRLPSNRQRVMLLVGSYAEARLVAEYITQLRQNWAHQVRHLIPDDEEFTGSWDGPSGLRRSDISTFADTGAWMLVAPLLAVERGHNILNDDDKAAIGAAYFLVRPHPRPDDLSYVIQRINQWATRQIRDAFPTVPGQNTTSLGALAEAFRHAGHRTWRRLLHTKLAYSSLPTDERDALAWTQLVTIWQVVGRLVRGGEHAEVYFCDAAFAPNTALRSEDKRDDPSLSLLLGLRHVLAPYFQQDTPSTDSYLVDVLYGCLYEALSTLEGL